MFRNSILFILTIVIGLPAVAQQMLTEREAVNKALANSKNIQAASLQIKQQQQLLKSAFNIPNPEFFLESPTGNFYTGSITQSFEFPSVYTNQHRLQKQQIEIAQKEKQITAAELKYTVKVLYLEVQYADSLAKQLYIQDTLYQRIMLSAIRQFKAGQIDYLQQTFAEIQYGEIHNLYQQSLIRAISFKAQLKWFIGSNDSIAVEPLTVAPSQIELTPAPDSASLLSNPTIQLLQQQERVSKQNILLQKSKAMPGLAFGYFNQG